MAVEAESIARVSAPVIGGCSPALRSYSFLNNRLVSLHTANASALGPGWWHSPKIVLSAAAWLVYALVKNVRYATRFRGARAAWLSIAGLLLLLAAFGTVTALRDKPAAPSADPVTGVDVSKEARR